ncbi:MAG TPA: hypothetical protein VFF76_09755 [Holophagaceae bacterium]|nr:hypothetical protein [Holophagaceae bacterium]
MNRLDFNAINADALPRLLDLAREVDANAKLEGEEISLRNPRRADANPGSFLINATKGQWADFASEDTGGDVVSWWAYLKGLGQAEAARDLARRFAPHLLPAEQRQAVNLPAPADAPEPDFARYAPNGTTFKAAWCYRDAHGARLGYAMRFEGPKGKEPRPLRWDGMSWRMEAFIAPRPLYNLRLLADRPGAEVIVCEGEKAADAAMVHFPECIAVTSPGGSSAPDKASWAPLQGRKVTIWPDHDEAGRKYADAVAKLAREAGAASVRVVKVPEDFPEKWDLADAIPDGADLRALLDGAEEGGFSEPRTLKTAKTAKTATGLPAIHVSNEAEVTEAALKALVPHADFFQRAGELVRVIHGGPGAATLGMVNSPWLRETLSRRAQFLSKEDGTRLVPDWLPAMILDRRVWPEVPELRALVTAPVFLNDGRILSEPGMDAASGLFFAPQRATPPTVLEAPTKADAEAARDALFEVVVDFPFASSPSPECHRAAWLAYVLSLVGRFAIDGPVPFGLFDAPSQGSGKGLLVKVSSLIALGSIGPANAASGDEEELRKAVLPILESGDRLGWLDDVSNPFGGRVWNALLTAWPEYRDRVLGKSVQRRVPALTVWAVTGNNLSLRGDSARRALHIRIEPPCERPEDRGGWRYADLLGWVREYQARLLAAALTILRAFHVAGRPASGLPALGSYEEWSRLIRDAVHWITGEDVSNTQRGLGALGDEGRIALRDFFAGIRSHFGTTTFDAARLVERFKGDEAAWQAAESLKRGTGELNGNRMGRILMRHRDAVVDGFRLEATPGGRVAFYRLAEIAVSAVFSVSEHRQPKEPDDDEGAA